MSRSAVGSDNRAWPNPTGPHLEPMVADALMADMGFMGLSYCGESPEAGLGKHHVTTREVARIQLGAKYFSFSICIPIGNRMISEGTLVTVALSE